jgi:hypothetical protein
MAEAPAYLCGANSIASAKRASGLPHLAHHKIVRTPPAPQVALALPYSDSASAKICLDDLDDLIASAVIHCFESAETKTPGLLYADCRWHREFLAIGHNVKQRRAAMRERLRNCARTRA